MKVDPTGPRRSAPAGRSARGGRADGGDFAEALPQGGEAAGAGGTAAGGATAIAGVEALIALQEVPDSTDGRARAKRRGEALLDRLEELRLGLLEGRLAPAQVEALARLAGERRGSCEDPDLEAVLGEIELRAAVELAKLGR